MNIFSFFSFLIVLSLAPFKNLISEDISPGYQHGIAMHGDLKYPKNFEKFDYADENAFKGGKINRFSIGTFDNLNPYILKGP